MSINLDYYYTNQAEQFSFYRIPKILFTDKSFAALSVEAKVLYGLLLDRMCLSLKNNWIDSENRVYIYFKLEEAMEYMNYGKDKCVKLFSELDGESGIGLIRRKKQGLGRPTIIYVMNFCNDTAEVKNSANEEITDELKSLSKNQKSSNNADSEVSEVQASEKPKSETHGEKNEENTKNTEVLTSEISKSGGVHSTEVLTSTKPKSALLQKRSHEVGKTDSNNTEINNTDFNETESILSDQEVDRIDRMVCAETVKKNIEYGYLIKVYIKDDIDGLINIIADAICAKKPYLVIAGEKVPKTIVADRFSKLNRGHIEYVMDSLNKNSTSIKNIKNYLLTALFNSISTIGHYYRAEVNSDLHGGTL